MRRSELAALDRADLTDVEDGLDVLIRRNKTGQEAQAGPSGSPAGATMTPAPSLPSTGGFASP